MIIEFGIIFKKVILYIGMDGITKKFEHVKKSVLHRESSEYLNFGENGLKSRKTMSRILETKGKEKGKI